MRRVLTVLLVLALLPSPADARVAVDAIRGLPPHAAGKDERCTDDGFSCVRVETFVPDICRTIERAAVDAQLDKHFLARLLWKESLFEPNAISPKGAEGIAQFMPGTARLVQLDDAFNPAKAVHAAANYLRRLELTFGNIGMAAVAYNGGEGRAERFRASGGTLPYETMDYVQAITGFDAWSWRTDPPAPDKVDLRLDREKPFFEACTELASKRKLRQFEGARPTVQPWGVMLASHPSRAGVQRQIGALQRKLRPVLGGREVSYVYRRVNGNPRRVYTAQIGAESRREAAQLCQKLRVVGSACIVLRN